jgi:hypothetical protein
MIMGSGTHQENGRSVMSRSSVWWSVDNLHMLTNELALREGLSVGIICNVRKVQKENTPISKKTKLTAGQSENEPKVQSLGIGDEM